MACGLPCVATSQTAQSVLIGEQRPPAHPRPVVVLWLLYIRNCLCRQPIAGRPHEQLSHLK